MLMHGDATFSAPFYVITLFSIGCIYVVIAWRCELGQVHFDMDPDP